MAQETIQGPGDRSWVGHVQGKPIILVFNTYTKGKVDPNVNGTSLLVLKL